MKMKRIMISGTNSGCGKTTVTCAILQALINRGLDTMSFKCGPDYIDPMFHSRIIGAKSRNLDPWFCDKDTLNYLINKHESEIAVTEGVMGYYDGVGDAASSYKVALDTDTPTIIVIDCKGMSMSIGAVMKGFLTFKTPNNIAGFIFNRLPESLVNTAKELCAEMGVKYFGRMSYVKDCFIESRHLGLVTADEIADLKQKMNTLAQIAEENILTDEIINTANENIPDYKSPEVKKITKTTPKIAVARDSAFCFYYQDSLDLLCDLGCEIIGFSPLSDTKLPDGVSGLILGGGYPELYAKSLSENREMLSDIKNKIENGLPVIAECGGFMYLHKTMEGNDGVKYAMAGVIDGEAYRTDKLQRFGYVDLKSTSDNLLCKSGDVLKAHEFHYWNSTSNGECFDAEKASNKMRYTCVHATDTAYMGFPHLYLYANIESAKRFVKKCEEYNEKA